MRAGYHAGRAARGDAIAASYVCLSRLDWAQLRGDAPQCVAQAGAPGESCPQTLSCAP